MHFRISIQKQNLFRKLVTAYIVASILANKIYTKICTESGLNYCFFKNFGAWSDYVDGKIDEAEFAEKAKPEVARMLAKNS